jgi:thioredoxin 1
MFKPFSVLWIIGISIIIGVTIIAFRYPADKNFETAADKSYNSQMQSNQIQPDNNQKIVEDQMKMVEDAKNDVSAKIESSGVLNYTDYSTEKLNTKSKQVLFFHAKWCSVCKATDQDIFQNIDKIPENLAIYKVDFDTSQELRRKYGITTQHTFVEIDSSGNQVQKWSGTTTLNQILAKIT